ncbi:NUDIX domain-containing protein [Streptomonospora salina]|uniref:Putative NUDIX family NTP pyrophosphohydrolase n=1 Tax=Streptomonospora salina TaxID=104205 RepID=A0A841E1U9_9ACTN|nr:NUDIX domain-containing protein [Streptomonospora salina]MBB5997105.1 putative NUDIX family NTP pyrophosphohydrolase [Streptomonospora salina]
MAKTSAGLLLYRWGAAGAVEVLLGHMGGPYWAKKDERAWSVPKGEYTAGEEPAAAARREFAEELGRSAPPGEPFVLGQVRQSGGKTVTCFALEGDFDASRIAGGTFAMEWPPRSGRTREFPEIDRAAWFDLPAARAKLVAGQVRFVDVLERAVGPAPGGSGA